ncbi:MAG TPA: hypothetical protein VGQ76_02400 [Thermoanaerobaculia bacterium]|jgi:hypothetical protein|nr:hypothetical protein [Thermoanaerobaculia bacterium]
MKPRAFVLAMLFVAPRLWAGCGSSSCPLDLNALNLPALHRFTFDLSVQYIDQDQPRSGTREVAVGAIPAHHDEVRTINRITTGTLTWAATERWHLTASLPFISRSHQHLGSSHEHSRGIAAEHNIIPQSWDIRGVGDLSLLARGHVASGLWVIGGLSLPTGANDVRNHEDDLGELPIQPGSGSTDVIGGLAWQSKVVRSSAVEGAMGNFAVMPYFVSATYRHRTGSGDRLGNELQLSAGTAVPITRSLEALVQLNGRVRSRDAMSDPEESELSGGRSLYASPGLRVSYRGAAFYAVAQLPLYQRVNAIQLTSDANYMLGMQTNF